MTTMWALFCKGQRVSRFFQSEREIWHYARKSALIMNRRLMQGFEIRELAASLLAPKETEALPARS
jgi:hypothetical protein